jgi:pentatricopeptide repeat protein
VVPTSDTLSLFMFLAAREDLSPQSVGLMLRRLNSARRVDDMWTVFQAIAGSQNFDLVRPSKLNVLVSALVMSDRFDDAMEVLSAMMNHSVECRPNNETFSILIHAALARDKQEIAETLYSMMEVRLLLHTVCPACRYMSCRLVRAPEHWAAT